MFEDPTAHTSHRPWPLPATPHNMHQTWNDLAFLHWPIAAEELRPHIPAGLDLDTYDGTAWLGIVPFRMSGVRPRRLPAAPWLSAFPELNVRTYVTRRSPNPPNPGVLFFSLDAANPVAVSIARRVYTLPYYRARIALEDNLSAIHFSSERTHSGAPPASFAAEYAPVGGIEKTEAGSLFYWFTERYCLYTTDRQGRLRQAEVHHLPWPLQTAECQIHANTVAAAAGVRLPDIAPVVHFARRLDVLIWPLRPVAI